MYYRNHNGSIEKTISSIPVRYYAIGFWLLIFGSSIQFLAFRYAPSLDGPQHLHNAYVLKDLVLDNGTIREFYDINDVPVGYWITHTLLSLFALVFPPWLAEKLLLLTFAVGLPLSYRYFIGSLPDGYNPLAQYLIFPFIPSFFLLAGYYAFSFGIVLMLLTYGYWNRVGEEFRWKFVPRFSLLLLFFYFTHGLVFAIFAITFLLHLLYESIVDLDRHGYLSQDFRQQGARILRVAVAFMPALIVLIVYSRSVAGLQASVGANPLGEKELIRQLFRIRPLIGFHHEMESVATKPLFIALLLVGITIAVQDAARIINRRSSFQDIFLERKTIYLMLSLLCLVVYMIDPDRFIAGSMTLRFGFLFFIFLIMWIPFHKIPLPVNLIMTLAILFAVIYNQALMPHFYKPQVDLIKELQELDKNIEEGSTIYTIRESDNWLHLHYGLYVGLTKHTVNLNNPQVYGPFPLVWDRDNAKAMFAGDIQINISGLGRPDPGTHPTRQVDYILVFYHNRFLEHEGYEAWKNTLNQYYTLVQTTSNQAAALYKRAGK